MKFKIIKCSVTYTFGGNFSQNNKISCYGIIGILENVFILDSIKYINQILALNKTISKMTLRTDGLLKTIILFTFFSDLLLVA